MYKIKTPEYRILSGTGSLAMGRPFLRCYSESKKWTPPYVIRIAVCTALESGPAPALLLSRRQIFRNRFVRRPRSRSGGPDR